MTHIDGVISKAKLIAYLNHSANELYDKGAHVPAGVMVILRDGVETGEIDLFPDLLPTDVDVKEIINVQLDIKQIFEAWNVHGICEQIESGYEQGVLIELIERAKLLAESDIFTKLAEKEAEIERLKETASQIDAQRFNAETAMREAEEKLNKAVEALTKIRYMADSQITYPNRYDLARIAFNAIQSIKGEQPNA